MFRILLAIVSFALMTAVSAEDVVATVQGPIMAGETAELKITSSGDDTPQIERLPKVDGLTWGRGVSVSSRTEIVNFRRSSVVECVVTFTVDREGAFSIPPVQVRVGKMKLATNPVSFEAVMRKFDAGGQGAGVGGDEAFFAKVAVISSKSSFYIGDEIPVEFRLYRLQSVNLKNISWPELDFGEGANVVFKDYRDVNPDNAKFDKAREGRESVGGHVYDVIIFNTVIRSLSAGKLPLKATMKTLVQVEDRNSHRSNSPFDDDFFFGSPLARGRSVERMLDASAPSIEIRPLPPAPKDVAFLGLVGTWQIVPSLTESHARVGEPLTLRLKINGAGSLETLNAPQLDLSGFRVYPPEVEKGKGDAEIRYVLIPTSEGESEIHLDVAVFDTASGQYKTVPFNKRVKIGKAQSLSGASAHEGQVVLGSRNSDSDSAPQSSAESQRKRPDGVLYLKKGIESTVSLPLWRNAVLPSLCILAFGLVGLLSMLAVSARREALAADPKLARRYAALSKRKALLKSLRESKPEALVEGISEELVPYLGDLLDAPPGAGVSEISAKLKARNPELSECLDKVADSAWSPERKASFDDSFKKRLVDSVSKLSLLFCVCLLTLSTAFGSDAKPLSIAKSVSTLGEAMTAYDSGDFAAAAVFFKSKLDPAKPSPAAFYDLGNCLYQTGDYPKALLCFERALRLSPRDSDILENLNLVRRKLDLPELYKLDSPSAALPCVRAFLRPDEWLCLGALGLALLMLSCGLRKLRKDSSLWLGLLASGLLLVLLSALCISAQQFSSYSKDHVLVLVRNASVKSLPSESSAPSELKLRPGEQLTVLERRGDWLLVRSNEGEGWLKLSDAAFVWHSDPASE